MKRITALFLALLLVLPLTTPAASAATTKAALESTYGFTLTGDNSQYTGAYAAEYLAQTEKALSVLNPTFVKSVCDFYRAKGYKVQFYLKTASWEEELGSFSISSTNKTARITLLIGSPEYSTAVSAGTTAHEFGHMLHSALDLKLGTSGVKSRWEALGMGENDFVTGYASTNYREDIAETFMSMIYERETYYRLPEGNVPLKKLLTFNDLLTASFPAYPGMEWYGFYLPQTPSSWSADTLAAMRAKGMLLPVPLYQAPISRGEFCQLVVSMTQNLWNPYDPETGWPILPADYDKLLQADYFSDVTFSGMITMSLDRTYYINKAYDLGIISGSGVGADGKPLFNADGAITRDAAAKMLTEACRVMGRDVSAANAAAFDDANSFQAWAVPYINYMRESEIMGGVGANRFGPRETYSYEQAYVTIWRILNNDV